MHTQLATRPKPKAPQKTFDDLPAELRNRIYLLALVDSKPLKPQSFHNSSRQSGGFGLLEPALTRTTHQIRRETLPIFYGNNTFRFDFDSSRFAEPTGASNDIGGWKKRVSPKKLQYVRRLWLDHTVLVFELCPSCHGYHPPFPGAAAGGESHHTILSLPDETEAALLGVDAAVVSIETSFKPTFRESCMCAPENVIRAGMPSKQIETPPWWRKKAEIEQTELLAVAAKFEAYLSTNETIASEKFGRERKCKLCGKAEYLFHGKPGLTKRSVRERRWSLGEFREGGLRQSRREGGDLGESRRMGGPRLFGDGGLFGGSSPVDDGDDTDVLFR